MKKLKKIDLMGGMNERVKRRLKRKKEKEFCKIDKSILNNIKIKK